MPASEICVVGWLNCFNYFIMGDNLDMFEQLCNLKLIVFDHEMGSL